MIHIGSTAISSHPKIGGNDCHFVMANNTLVYPHLLFKGPAGEVNSSNCACPSRSGYVQMGVCPANGYKYSDPDARSNLGLDVYTHDAWNVCAGSLGSVLGVWRYRTELKLDITAAVTVGIGVAMLGTDYSAVWVDGGDMYVDQNWHTYDFSWGHTLLAGATYAPCYRYWTSHLVERNACITFEAY